MIKKCIILRNGSEFWVSKETADKLEAQIVGQDKHNFIKIKELDRTINSADITEIATAEQMDERQRIKNKEFKCQWNKWHARGEKCDCGYQIARKKKEDEEEKQRQEDMRPRTPEEQEATRKAIAKMRKELEDKGVLVAKKMKIEHDNN